MEKLPHQQKEYEDTTLDYKIKCLEEKNLYSEAENQVLRRLRTLVLQRNKQELKKKR